MVSVSFSEGEGVLVCGPARVIVSKGAVEVFGKICGRGDEFVVTYGKTYPLQSLTETELKLFLRSSKDYVKVRDRLIPKGWETLSDLMMDGRARGSRIVMILGETDTGKSSLVLYTANRLCSENYKTMVIDTDIGQSDVGPPGVIGLCKVEVPTLSLMEVPLLSGYFVGDKNPSGHFLDMILGTKSMVEEALKIGADVILINTTGMVYGGPARTLKEKKIEAVSPDIIAALQRNGEIEHLLLPLKDRFNVLRLPVPDRMKRTGRRERIALRGFSMRKYVKDVKNISFSLDRIVFKETFLDTGVVKPGMRYELSDILKSEVLYVEEASDVLLIVVKGIYSREGARTLREDYGKEIKIAKIDWLERLIVGLLDNDERFIDIGFLESIDFQNRKMIVSTSIRDETVVKYTKLGYLRIDERGNEMGRREIGII